MRHAVKVLVPVSGGKDSQLCLELALEIYAKDQVRGLFCDTEFEHPATYAHIEKTREMYGVRIDTTNAGNVPDKVRKYQRFPSGTARFCTDELKIRPTIIYLRTLATQQGEGFEVWYGVRTGESTDRAKRYADRVAHEVYAPHEYMSKYPKGLAKLGVSVRLPIIDWSTAQVHAEMEGRLNTLYGEGFDRVGCFPCLAAGDAAKERAFAYDDFGKAQKTLVIALERETGKSVWTSKGGKARNADAMCAMCQI